jgi:hypothetical protein
VSHFVAAVAPMAGKSTADRGAIQELRPYNLEGAGRLISYYSDLHRTPEREAGAVVLRPCFCHALQQVWPGYQRPLDQRNWLWLRTGGMERAVK